MGANKSKLAAMAATDPEAVWNRHGLHPASIITTAKVGSGNGLPMMPKMTVDDEAVEGGKKGKYLRFVAISDTHNCHADLEIPPGDVLVHAGDLTVGGTVKEVEDFNRWLGTLPHKHKIVIAGNHDFAFDEDMCEEEVWAKLQKSHAKEPEPAPPPFKGRAAAEKLLTNCRYLCGDSVSVEGVEVYGVPHQPSIKVIDHKMAFNLDSEEELAKEFTKIPATASVLLTHGPPAECGRIDRILGGFSVGSSALRKRIEELGGEQGALQYCVCGHLHEGYGVGTIGRVVCINAASVSCHYKAAHPPVVFDVPIPAAGPH